MSKKRKIYWRKLDDQAKVFSLSFSKRDTSIFRLSTILKNKIEPNFLQKALELALEKYKAFKVKMQKGFFWYYLVENEKTPIVRKSNKSTYKKINTKSNNDYLFKVTYFDKKINIDYFHTLTDGNSGKEFFKEIIYKYLELKYPNAIKADFDDNKIFEDCENSYTKNYQKNSKKSDVSPKAYQIKGEELEPGKIGINHFSIKLNELKKYAETKKSSISMLLVAMISYALYESNYKKNSGKKPINVCVPINLKKYFSSETLSNFVSYMIVSLKVKKKKKHSFDDILEMVKSEFAKKLNKEKIVGTMSSNGRVINNFFIKIVPLPLKRFFVRLGSLEVKRHSTLTFSNLGESNIKSKYSKFIKKFSFELTPDWAEKLRCGVCTHNDNLVISFGSILKDNKIETKFKELLSENGIKFKLSNNGVNAVV